MCGSPNNTYHKQTYIEDKNIYVDEELVHVLRYMWDKGTETLFSCQGAPSEELTEKERLHASRTGYIMYKADEEFNPHPMQVLPVELHECVEMVEFKGPNEYHAYNRIVIRFHRFSLNDVLTRFTPEGS